MTGRWILKTLVGITLLLSSTTWASPNDILPEDAYYQTQSLNGGDEVYQQEDSYPNDADSRAMPASSPPRSSPFGYRGQSMRRHSRGDDEYSALDDIRIHGGFALINSLQQVPVDGEHLSTASSRGIQANLGIDLFSPNWIAEGSVLNYPETRQDNFTVASNGFELKIFYTGAIIERVTLHGGPGISSRNFTIKTDSSSASRSVSAANTVLAFGADYWVSGHLSIGLEGSARMPMVSANDPQSTDFAIRIDGHF